MAINIFIKVDAVFLCFMKDKLQFKVKKKSITENLSK